MNKEFQLSNPPQDAISSVQFSPSKEDLLAVSDWNREVRVFNTTLNTSVASTKAKAAILDVCWNKTENKLYFGGLDREVASFDIEGMHMAKIGEHDAAVSCMASTEDSLITGSWDCSVKIWDVRSDQLSIKLDQIEKV